MAKALTDAEKALSIARWFRGRQESRIPGPDADLRDPYAHWLTAHEAYCVVREQFPAEITPECSADLRQAVCETFPELFS